MLIPVHAHFRAFCSASGPYLPSGALQGALQHLHMEETVAETMLLLLWRMMLSVSGATVPAVRCCMHSVHVVHDALFQREMIWDADLTSSHPDASDLGKGLSPHIRD